MWKYIFLIVLGKYNSKCICKTLISEAFCSNIFAPSFASDIFVGLLIFVPWFCTICLGKYFVKKSLLLFIRLIVRIFSVINYKFFFFFFFFFLFSLFFCSVVFFFYFFYLIFLLFLFFFLCPLCNYFVSAYIICTFNWKKKNNKNLRARVERTS